MALSQQLQKQKLEVHTNYSKREYMYQSELAKNVSYKFKIKQNRHSVQTY